MSPAKQQLVNVVLFLARVWTCFFLIIVVYTDLRMPNLVQISDFVTCMYTGSKLFAMGRLSEVYAPYTATRFAGTPCDIAAHAFLPHMPSAMVSNYNYCPLIAWMLAPITYLAPEMCLLVWQIVLVIAFAAGMYFLCDSTQRKSKPSRPPSRHKDSDTQAQLNLDRAPEEAVSSIAEQPRSVSRSHLALFLSTSLWFLPTAFTLWIGQFGIVFGIFFYSLGYWLLCRNRQFAAGVAFAMACLKPQFVIVPGLLALVFLLKRQWRFPIGLTVSGLLLVVLNVAVSGLEFFQRWVWMMRLSEMVFTDPGSGLPRHLLMSLPGSLLLMLSTEQHKFVKPLLYAATGVIGLLAAWACHRFDKAYPADRRSLIGFTMLLGILLLPLLIPHLMYYDLTIFMVAFVLCSDSTLQKTSGLPLLKLALIIGVAIDVYAILFLAKLPFVHPLPVLLLIAGSFAWLVMQAGKLKPSPDQVSRRS